VSLVASTGPSRGRSQHSLLVSVGTIFRTDTYHAEYIPTVTVQMVLCTVAVLPHPSLPRFKEHVCYSTALTAVTALDVTCRQALGCLLA
jgi:hypothetical protein